MSLSRTDPNLNIANESGTRTPRYSWPTLLLHLHETTAVQTFSLFRCIFQHRHLSPWEQAQRNQKRQKDARTKGTEPQEYSAAVSLPAVATTLSRRASCSASLDNDCLPKFTVWSYYSFISNLEIRRQCTTKYRKLVANYKVTVGIVTWWNSITASCNWRLSPECMNTVSAMTYILLRH
jgi:hypothetical protein